MLTRYAEHEIEDIIKHSITMKDDGVKMLLHLARRSRAKIFGRLLHLHHETRSSSELVNVADVGGYQYNHKTPLVYPNHSKDGSFHLLSGDHVVLQIRNLTDHELHFHILHFGSALSVNVLHPSAMGHSTLLLPLHQVIQRYRLAIEGGIDGGPDEVGVRQVLKVIITDHPTSFEGHKMSPLCFDESKMNGDPIQSVLSSYKSGKNDTDVDMAA